MGQSSKLEEPKRLVSLDAYRGFVMLAMASGGFAIARVYHKFPMVATRYDGTNFQTAWESLWRTLAIQLEHVVWFGCVAWDLIQPSFMFMVGAALPFSAAGRESRGDSKLAWWGHVLLRSFILIALGIFLRSRGSSMTNFTFEDVLTQIGLGYAIVALLVNRRFWFQFAALVVVLAGSWLMFYFHPVPAENSDIVQYMTEVRKFDPSEWEKLGGLAAHWNKHTNFAAEADRWFLNLFPRPEEEWRGKKFWINGGGYQTLNFVPSMATMILGLIAGSLLRGAERPGEKFQKLITGGAICFLVAMAVDTTIWPISPEQFGWNGWSLCPIVKKIWTPSWALFSGGWCLMTLAAFYWIIDVKGFQRLAFPLVVVGMNSIVMYCMAGMISGWVAAMLKIHLTTIDSLTLNWGAKTYKTRFVEYLFSPTYPYAPILLSMTVLFVLWLICLWLYKRRLFVRI
ncbi:MAG: acyltransferase family protein [Planctomycetaceae bacterium]